MSNRFNKILIHYFLFSDSGDSSRQRSPSPEGRQSPKKTETIPPRRFISSILGGDIPYGSRGHVLTRAERKEYSPLPVSEKLILPPAKKPSETPSPPSLVTPVRCSVIQRTPKTSKRDEDAEQRIPEPMVQEPEQDQPIDYHIPKRRGETEDENEERKNREQRISHCNKIAKPIIAVRTLIGTLYFSRI